MFAANNLTKLAPKIASNAVQQTRNYTHLISKPRCRVSFAEKCAHGLVLAIVPLTIPMYISTKLKEWNQGGE